jgi:deoxycytidylate deaminase
VKLSEPTDELIKYLGFALYQSVLSKALNKNIGACLVPPSEVPVGSYNGPPRKIEDSLERFTPNERLKLDHFGETDPRYLLGYKSGQGLRYQIDVHAEVNLVINAARAGISTLGSRVYLTCPIPCKDCCMVLIQAGIKELYFAESSLGYTDEQSDYNFYMSRWLLNNSLIMCYEYPIECLYTAAKKFEVNITEKLGVGLKF